MMLGMILVFFCALIVSAQINLGSAALIVGTMLAINTVFWMTQPVMTVVGVATDVRFCGCGHDVLPDYI